MLLNLTTDDEGKTVVTHDGKEIGEIVEFENGKAYVEPDGVVPRQTQRKLGWGDADSEPFVLSNSMVYSITERKVRVRR